MKFFHIVITEPAENDLNGIAYYVANELREPSFAGGLLDKIGSAIFDLETLPLRNALVRDEKLAAQGIRKLIVENYIVFYVVSEKAGSVTIIRILYNKRDWLNLL